MLGRWEPFTQMEAEFNRLRDEMDRLFRRFGGNGNLWRRAPAEFPAVDIWEDDNDLYLEAELPGMELDDTWHRRERGFGEFTRVITLPVDVDADKVEATLKHGVLTVKVAEARVRKIPVKAD